jgi:50S ribosomal subunit-associated GTPase HflX
VFTSALKGEGLDTLRVRLAEAAAAGWKRVKTTLPYHAGALVQRIRTRGSLKSVDYEEGGIRIEADVPPELAVEIQTAVRRR